MWFLCVIGVVLAFFLSCCCWVLFEVVCIPTLQGGILVCTLISYVYHLYPWILFLWCICTVLIDCPILMLYLQSALHVIGFVELLLRTGCFQHRIGCREETSQLVLGLFAGVGVG